MKKLLLVSTAVLALTVVSFGQVSKYAGHYEGIIKSDTAMIKITFDLNKDSTYTIKMEFGLKPWCNFAHGINIYKGKWATDSGWIYVAPSSDTLNDGDNDAPVFAFVPSLIDEPSINIHSKMDKQGFHPLSKIKSDKMNCVKFYFHIGIDCFENIWNNWYIQNTNCK